MSGVCKITGIKSPADSFPNHAELFRNRAIPRSYPFRTRRRFWFYTQNAGVVWRLTHSVPITHEASRYGLLLPSRQDARP